MFRPLVAIGIIFTSAALAAQPHRGAATFPLTIDSIMRGPDLVGYPPENLRWSGDSQRLYFEWRKAADDVAATWVVSRTGAEPRRLSDEERLSAPLPVGQWDAARRRQLSVDEGDIVIIDTAAGRRLEIAKTTAIESAPRWARNESAVTFVRDNNLFLAPLGPDGGGIVQLTDVVSRPPESRTTDSQRTLRREETDVLGWVEQERGRRERREARTARRAPARFELGERQSVNDAAVSSSGEYAFLMVVDRAQSRAANVPRFVSESAYTEDISARTKVGDAQDRRRLAVLNLETGEGVWAGLEGIADPLSIPKPKRGDTSGDAPVTAPSAPKPTREVRWGALLLSPDAAHAVVSVRSEDNMDRWLVLLDPGQRPHAGAGPRTRCGMGARHRTGREHERRPGLAPGQPAAVVPCRARRLDAAYTVDVTAASPARVAITSGAFEIDSVEVSADGGSFYLQSTEAHPGERQITGSPPTAERGSG